MSLVYVFAITRHRAAAFACEGHRIDFTGAAGVAAAIEHIARAAAALGSVTAGAARDRPADRGGGGRNPAGPVRGVRSSATNSTAF